MAKNKEDNLIGEFCYEKDILKKAIEILKKYQRPNDTVWIKPLEDFESNFIFGA